MNKAGKSLLRAVAVGGLMAVLAVHALGESLFTPQDPYTGIPDDPGKTVVGVQASKGAPENLSFEVPLYVSMAAVEGPQLLCPTNYSIRNTSQVGETEINIAVTGLTIQRVPGGSWALTDLPASGRQLSLSVGNVPLPPLTGNAWQPVDIMVPNSAFYNVGTGKYLPVPRTGMGLILPLKGVLPAGWAPVENTGAVPQFRLRYRVSALDKNGNPIGVFYEGPAKEEAQTPSSSAPTP